MKNTKRILLPTAYFPPVSYFVYLALFDDPVIELMETYPKQTYRNRCEIMTSGGKMKLVVPVSKTTGNHTITADIRITYREHWNRHHWKSIQTAYFSSPYFSYYADIIEPLFKTDESNLIRHNKKILSIMLKILGWEREISYSADFEKEPDNVVDLRLAYKPGKGHQELIFLPYPQVFSHLHGFMEDLSILDLIFNLGPEAGRYLEDCSQSLK